ncbi:hypothetical protein [Wolbachia endosymbiont of Pentidionis agamae]|uniref:hypothetical protein n=1 Tax=Wolbachia endosymbiont of Pentidionis agamae TaxID=3110435 RepID=UPI002FD1F6B4
MKKLSNTAPLLFQWIPREFGLTLPKLYQERIFNWRKREPQRDIYLVVNGSGFTRKQLADLTQEMKEHKITVINFNELNLKRYDFTIPIGEREIKISDYYRDMYSHNFKRISDEEGKIRFDIELSMMRLLMLTQVKEFTRGNEAIYLDFDKLPEKNGQQIGEANIPYDTVWLFRTCCYCYL